MTKRNKVERMIIVNTLLTSIYEELLNGEVDDIDGLLQIAVYAQVEMNRIVFKLNQLNGREPQEETEAERLDRIDNEIEDAWARIRELTDEPQTDCSWK